MFNDSIEPKTTFQTPDEGYKMTLTLSFIAYLIYTDSIDTVEITATI